MGLPAFGSTVYLELLFMFYMKSFLGYYINVALIFRCLFPFTKLSLCMKMWHYV